MYICTFPYVRLYIYTYICIYMHLHAYSCIHMHIHTHTYTYIYTFVCIHGSHLMASSAVLVPSPSKVPSVSAGGR